MAEQQVQTGQTPGGATAGPASSTQPPETPAAATAAPASTNPLGLSDREIFDMTGQRPDERQPEPDGNAGASNDTAANQGPAKAGDPSDAAGAKPPAAEGPVVEIQPGLVVPLPPDIAGSLTGLGPAKEPAKADAAAADAAASAVAPVDDATLAGNITKMLRPKGAETSPEEVEQNAIRALTEKERYIGQQAKEKGDLREIGRNLVKTYLPLFETDAKGQPIKLSIEKVANQLGNEEVTRQLAALGMKVVPIHANAADEVAAMMREVKEQVASTMVAGDELKPAQKLATLKSQMESDTELRERFEAAVSATMWSRNLEKAAKEQAASEQKKAATRAQEDHWKRETDAAVAEFEKLPHKDRLRPHMIEAKAELDAAGVNVRGGLRVKILRALGEMATLQERVQQTYRAGFLQGIQHQQGVADGTLVAGGAPPTINTSGEPGTGMPITIQQAQKLFL